MITLKEKKVGGEQLYTMASTDHSASFTVMASQGAALLALQLGHKSESHTILKSYGTLEQSINQYQQRFIGSQLFPFPNRLSQGKYRVANKGYEFPHNDFGRPNALHGHLYVKPFELVSFDTSRAELTLKYDYLGSDPSYPFPYSIKNVFHLVSDKLAVTTVIVNKAELSVPYGYGWHPYFSAEDGIADCSLRLPTSVTLSVD